METSQNRLLLESLQIKHVLTAGLELESPKHPFCSYLHIPARDNKHEPLKDYFEKCNEFIGAA